MSGRGKMAPPPDPDDPRRRRDPGAGLRAHVEAQGVDTQPPRPDPAAEAAQSDSGPSAAGWRAEMLETLAQVQREDPHVIPLSKVTITDEPGDSGVSHIDPQQVLDAFGVTQEEVDSVAPPLASLEAAEAQRDAVVERYTAQAGLMAERLDEVLKRTAQHVEQHAQPGAAKDGALADIHRAVEKVEGQAYRPERDIVSPYAGLRALSLADMKIFVTNLIEDRNSTHHRPGTGPHYRQEGEVNALRMVLDYIDNPPREHQQGQPSITCPTCGRISYNPNDIEHAYCGSCGYHDQLKQR